MRIKSKRLMVAAFAGVLAAPASALATNGYFAIGYGAGSVGMGGIGVTTPQDTLCVGGNPACLGEFTTPQFDIGAGLFLPRRRSAAAGSYFTGGNVWSDSNFFLIPGMGFVFPFNDHLTFGFAAIGNGGMNVTYRKNFFNAVATSTTPTEYLGVDMIQLLVPITVAYKVNDAHTLAFSVVPARARFLAQGLQEFGVLGYSSDPENMTNNGHDYSNGMGVRGGWAGHFFDKKLTLGATYASKVFMHKFVRYKGLFANEGSFDIAANYAVGIAVKPIPKLTVALDVQKILYSDVPTVANRGPSTLDGGDDYNVTQLGKPGGMGFGWTDQTVYKLGVVYQGAFPSLFGDKLTLRAGYNYGKSPIPDKELLFNLLAPGVVEKHYTLGLTYSLGEQSILGFGSEGALTLAWQRAQRRTQGVSNIYFADQRPAVGPVEAEMIQDVIDIAYTLKF